MTGGLLSVDCVSLKIRETSERNTKILFEHQANYVCQESQKINIKREGSEMALKYWKKVCCVCSSFRIIFY